ncbi:MAG: hypothetical protein JST45_09935 [Bacteroidetes bacterium]|nr:hypothetical protein [Bacteroidota bacterium]
MSKATAVSVKVTCHSPLQQPKGGCSSSGSSEITWKFMGVYLDHGSCVVVAEAGAARDAANCKVDGGEGVFPGGAGGRYCELTLDTGNMDNWSVKVATDKDKARGKGIVFQAGAGLAGNGGGAGK